MWSCGWESGVLTGHGLTTTSWQIPMSTRIAIADNPSVPLDRVGWRCPQLLGCKSGGGPIRRVRSNEDRA